MVVVRSLNVKSTSLAPGERHVKGTRVYSHRYNCEPDIRLSNLWRAPGLPTVLSFRRIGDRFVDTGYGRKILRFSFVHSLASTKNFTVWIWISTIVMNNLYFTSVKLILRNIFSSIFILTFWPNFFLVETLGNSGEKEELGNFEEHWNGAKEAKKKRE